ncbi:hypothetical protein SAMN04487905_11730 [Actinopolyspora xinjiangensis]|uniref:Uncharacterized protein n=1 Tax=Actinopolyspora xinjiangensis TaxID=405564 RepID=A0A1H0WWS9_9ACTN|nr:hypothetical protein SAMN04487905_11730 [Actinopolyspora xinjiangensis]
MSESSCSNPRPMDVTIAESVVRTATGTVDSEMVDQIARVLARHSAFSSELADTAARGMLTPEEVTEVSARAHEVTEREIQRVLARAPVHDSEVPVPPQPRGRPAVETYESDPAPVSRTAAAMLGVHP